MSALLLDSNSSPEVSATILLKIPGDLGGLGLRKVGFGEGRDFSGV